MAQLPKNVDLILLVNLELLGYSALVRQGSLMVRTKGKLHFQLIKLKNCNYYCNIELLHYHRMEYFKDQSCKLSWQTLITFNLSPNNFFFGDKLSLTHIKLYPLLAVKT